MTYALSFAHEFFWEDGSIPPEQLKPNQRPTSVHQALLSLTENKWASIARDIFRVEAKDLEPITVMDKVLETNTCRNLDSPVEVFIDPDGWYTLLIHETRKEPCP